MKLSPPFNSLSVNEVGLVFSNEKFEKEIMHLENSYSLSYFDKQPPLPKFRGMGDDEGLFVIVPEHRNWYPTDKPAGIFPMVVEFDNGGKSYNLEVIQTVFLTLFLLSLAFHHSIASYCLVSQTTFRFVLSR